MGVFKFYKNKKDDNEGQQSNEKTDNKSNEPSKQLENKSSQEPNKTYYESESEKLGFKKLAKNLSQSLIAWNKAGRPIVSTTQWDYRLSICRGCEFWQEVGKTQIARCKKCGCSSGKLLLATSSCPLSPPKWKAYK
jgi:hypothetical protein